MVSILTLFNILRIQAIHLESFIVTSQNTPHALTQALQTIQSPNTTFQFFQYSSETLTYIHQYPPVFIVDASSSLIFSHNLQSLSQKLGVVLFKIGKPQQNRSQWTFYSSPSFYYENQALDSLIAYFDWESFHLFSSEKLLSLPSAKHFQNNFQGINGDLNILTDTLGIDVFTLYIGRLIKPTGNWKMLIFNEKESSQKIIESLEKMKMMRKGCGVILKFSGLTQVQKGLIVVAEEGTQTSSDFYDFQVKQIQLMISLLEDIFQSLSLNHVVSNDRVRQELERLTEKGGRIPKYLILNSKEENILTEVGRIEGTEVNITETLILPGGQTQFTNDILQIRYSQHSGFISHLGQFDSGNYVFMGAIQIYLDIINSDDQQFQNFKLVPTNVQCGSAIFYYDYFKQCYQGLRNSLGVFYLHPSTTITIDVVQLWRELELKTFQIGFYSYRELIYDKELYPQIVLATFAERVVYSFLPTYIAYHGWKNLIVAQSQTYYQFRTSQSFFQSCENLGITIWNSEQSRVIPDNYNAETDFQTYRHYFQEYYDSGVRVIAMLYMYNEFLDFVLSLYKIGFRQGDIQIFTVYEPAPVINLNSAKFSEESMRQIYSLINGVVWKYVAQYVNQYWMSIQPLVQQALGTDTVDTSCYSMDMLQLGAYAVDNLLTTGRDYQDENLVNESVRMQRFPGCTGTFSIDSSSNERRDTLTILGYTLYNIDTGESFRYIKGTYSPVQNPVFVIQGEFEYSNESSIPPSDMRFEEWDCDFHKEIVEENDKSQNLEAILIGGVIGLSVIVSLIFLFIFKPKQGIQMSTEQNVMGLDDVILLLSVGIENIQYLMLGPDFQRLNPYIHLIGNYLSISFINIYSLRFQQFWLFYYIFSGVASLWILLIVGYFLTFVSRVQGRITSLFKEIGEKAMPGLPNILLVPILMVLFKVFDCKEGTSEELLDSFMSLDCDTFCWQEDHLYSVIGGLFVIFFLCIFTLGYRLIYSLSSEDKNIRILPLYNYIRGLIQIILVTLHTVLKRKFKLIFNVLFCVIIIGYLIFSQKLTVYNHKRLQLMQVFAIGGVLWSILLTTVFDLGTNGEINFGYQIGFSILQIFGWALLLFIFFIAYKRLPSMFYKFKVKYNVTELFRFMFGKQDLKTTMSKIYNKTYKFKKENVREEVKQPTGTGGIINSTFQYNH